MANRTEGHILMAAPRVRMSFFNKCAYGLGITLVLTFPPLLTISFIPYMRDKRDKPKE